METEKRAFINGMQPEERVKLPQYQCFKKVRAAKITRIGEEGVVLRPYGEEPRKFVLALDVGVEVVVSQAWMEKRMPEVGGYFVLYEDGYSSFSPGDVFEEGYRTFKRVKAEDEAEEAIDRKFEFLALNPVNGKLYNEKNAIILCAKDRAVPAALKALRDQCCLLGSNPEHLESLGLLIDRVMRYQEKRGGGRVADTVGDEIPRCLKDIGV